VNRDLPGPFSQHLQLPESQSVGQSVQHNKSNDTSLWSNVTFWGKNWVL